MPALEFRAGLLRWTDNNVIDPNTPSGGPWFFVFCSCWVITTSYSTKPINAHE